MSGINEYFSRYAGRNFLRPFIAGIDNLMAYSFNKRPSKGPLYIGWNITFKCNCKCDYCQAWRFCDKDKELDTEECLKIVKEIGKAGVALLSITGGEPLLREDLYEIILEAKRHNISVNVITNGALLEAQADSLVSSGVDAITVSLDSSFPGEHDLIKHHDGLFQKVESGIKKMRRIRKNNKPRVLVGLTITSKNHKNIQGFIEYWSEMADGILFQPVHNSLAPSIFKVSDHGLLFSQEDKKEFAKTCNDMAKRYGYFKSAYEKEFINFFFDTSRLSQKYKCFAGFFMSQIDAYGNVYPCPEFVENMGSLRKEKFSDIWNGKKINSFRKDIKNRINNCFCWYRCTGPINSYLNKLI